MISFCTLGDTHGWPGVYHLAVRAFQLLSFMHVRQLMGVDGELRSTCGFLNKQMPNGSFQNEEKIRWQVKLLPIKMYTQLNLLSHWGIDKVTLRATWCHPYIVFLELPATWLHSICTPEANERLSSTDQKKERDLQWLFSISFQQTACRLPFQNPHQPLLGVAYAQPPVPGEFMVGFIPQPWPLYCSWCFSPLLPAGSLLLDGSRSRPHVLCAHQGLQYLCSQLHT